MSNDIKQLNEPFEKEAKLLNSVKTEIAKVVIGQHAMIERFLISLICNTHVLIEGIPGLAKTLAVKTLSDVLNFSFQRIQFTPDLLPGDLIGTLIYNQASGEFTPHKGPIFNNIILADEINRAPAKVQSALLEAMQERQVTLGKESYPLSTPFMVLATQNPIEQEGTYPLPEAQVDRFMFKITLDYPTKDEELQIIKKMAKSAPDLSVKPILTSDDFIRLRQLLDKVFMDEKIERYILDIISATRTPADFKLDMADMIRFGASPRAGIYLAIAARAKAILEGRSYVIPDDVKTVAMDILRHRLILTYRAEAEDVPPESLITKILNNIEVP
jgi:MoxR-like ATPase